MSKAVRRINGEKTMTYRTYFLILISLPSIAWCIYKIKQWFEKQPKQIRIKLLQFIFAAIIFIAGAFISLNMISNINNTDSSSNYSVEVENE